MEKIFVFAGTTEGREIVDKIKGFDVEITAFVATEYGSTLISSDVNVINERLSSKDMENLFLKENPKFVIDATHPYALLVTENIKKACENTKITYIRLLREETSYNFGIVVSDIKEASLKINELSGNVLVTTGSKELDILHENVLDVSRLFARVLPTKEVLDKCHSLNINTKNIIAMQGPFSKELNIALCKAFDIKIILSKDGGKVGGFSEKLECAKELGLTLITIGRESSDFGFSLDEVYNIISSNFANNLQKNAYFPLNISLKNENILVVGGGEIATRRIKTLMNFTKNITCVSKTFSNEILNLDIKKINSEFSDDYLQDKFMCVACTDDKNLNRDIAYLCKKLKIHHSIASDKDLCSFYFPGVIFSDDIVVSVCGNGENHKKTKEKITKIRGLI